MTNFKDQISIEIFILQYLHFYSYEENKFEFAGKIIPLKLILNRHDLYQ